MIGMHIGNRVDILDVISMSDEFAPLSWKFLRVSGSDVWSYIDLRCNFLLVDQLSGELG